MIATTSFLSALALNASSTFALFCRQCTFSPALRAAILASAFIIQFFTIPPAQAEDANFFLNRGLRYMKEKKYYEALADLWLVSKRQTLPPYVMGEIERAYASLGDYETASHFLNGPVFEDENAHFGYDERSLVSFGLKNFSKALANCKEAIRRKPDDAFAYNDCGAASRELGHLQEAVQYYDEVIRLQPDLVNAWTGRGVSYARMGKMDRATSDCEHALELNSKYSFAYYCRGLIAEANGTFLLAAREFETALSIDPTNNLYLEAWSRATKAPISHETRVALVIGNADYKGAPLHSPVRDANTVAAALEKVGFKVIKGTNVNRQVMWQMFEEFNKVASESDVALFYFSGHGGEYKGQNYLVPADVDLADDSAFQFEYRPHAFEGAGKYIDLQDFINQLQNYDKTRIIIVDACRTSEGFAAWDKRGLVPEGFQDSTEGMFVAYATSFDQYSYDDGGTISATTFSQALADNLTRKGVELRDVFKAVSATTAAAKLETPQSIDRMEHKFYFYPADVRFPLADTAP